MRCDASVLRFAVVPTTRCPLEIGFRAFGARFSAVARTRYRGLKPATPVRVFSEVVAYFDWTRWEQVAAPMVHRVSILRAHTALR